MKLSDVTRDDGIRCANLFNLLKNGRFTLSDADTEEYTRVKKWLHDLMLEMARQLKTEAKAPAPAAAPEGGFKVKAMGRLPAATKPAKFKKAK